MSQITATQLGTWCSLLEECYYRNDDTYTVIAQHIEDVLTYFDIPREWQPVVRIMAQSTCYYGEDEWYNTYVASNHRP